MLNVLVKDSEISPRDHCLSFFSNLQVHEVIFNLEELKLYGALNSENPQDVLNVLVKDFGIMLPGDVPEDIKAMTDAPGAS